jgi:hypothetical protein
VFAPLVHRPGEEAQVDFFVGSERELTERFTALVRHYPFEPCFTRPGEGHDKSGVEARGKGMRLAHLTRIPRGESLSEISEVLLRSQAQTHRE